MHLHYYIFIFIIFDTLLYFSLYLSLPFSFSECKTRFADYPRLDTFPIRSYNGHVISKNATGVHYFFIRTSNFAVEAETKVAVLFFSFFVLSLKRS